jgi:hypothetical protein
METQQTKKRTPEQEEYRISQLRAALCGRKRPPEVVAKIRAANIGKKRTPEQIEAFKKLLAEGRAIGKYKSSPEGAERRKLAAIAANKGLKRTEEQKRRHSETMRGRKAKPEHIEKRIAPMIGREQTATATAKGPSNIGSIQGALRDAKGRIWWFTNLTHFVRTHEELFSPEDVKWIPERPGRITLRCNAQKRLLSLFGRGKTVPGTWKGWTVAHSTVERLGGCADLLGRDTSTLVPVRDIEPNVPGI